MHCLTDRATFSWHLDVQCTSCVNWSVFGWCLLSEPHLVLPICGNHMVSDCSIDLIDGLPHGRFPGVLVRHVSSVSLIAMWHLRNFDEYDDKSGDKKFIIYCFIYTQGLARHSHNNICYVKVIEIIIKWFIITGLPLGWGNCQVFWAGLR